MKSLIFCIHRCSHLLSRLLSKIVVPFYFILLLFIGIACHNEKKQKASSDKQSEADTIQKSKLRNPISRYADISLGVNDLKISIDFWEKIGFSVIGQGQKPNLWAELTDSSVIISLKQDSSYYMGWNFYHNKLSELLDTLPEDVSKKQVKTNDQRQAFFISPDSNILSVVTAEASHKNLRGTFVNYIDFVSKQNFSLQEVELPNKKLGVFGELSYPVADLITAIEFWEQLGFRSDGVMQSPYPFGVMYDGNHIVGLHETEKFSKPGLTYFSGNQSKNIENIKKMGFEVVEFMPGMEDKNVVLQSPSGYNIFIFSTDL